MPTGYLETKGRRAPTRAEDIEIALRVLLDALPRALDPLPPLYRSMVEGGLSKIPEVCRDALEPRP